MSTMRSQSGSPRTSAPRSTRRWIADSRVRVLSSPSAIRLGARAVPAIAAPCRAGRPRGERPAGRRPCRPRRPAGRDSDTADERGRRRRVVVDALARIAGQPWIARRGGRGSWPWSTSCRACRADTADPTDEEALLGCDLLVAVSPSVRDTLTARGVPVERIRIVAPGFDRHCSEPAFPVGRARCRCSALPSGSVARASWSCCMRGGAGSGRRPTRPGRRNRCPPELRGRGPDVAERRHRRPRIRR